MNTATRDSKVVMPPGNYFLGDPGYCFKDSWEKIVDNYYDDEGVLVKYKKKIILMFSTAFGDGGYPSNEYPGFDFPVDSGLIGLVPVNLIETDKDDLKHCGKFISFKEQFICESSKNGDLTFGHIVIRTGESEENELDYAYEEDFV